MRERIEGTGGGRLRHALQLSDVDDGHEEQAAKARGAPAEIGAPPSAVSLHGPYRTGVLPAILKETAVGFPAAGGVRSAAASAPPHNATAHDVPVPPLKLPSVRRGGPRSARVANAPSGRSPRAQPAAGQAEHMKVLPELLKEAQHSVLAPIQASLRGRPAFYGS